MPTASPNNIKIAFFGTSDFAVIVLDELKAAGFLPSLIITNPDRPKGRGMTLTPPPVKVWAEKEHIPVLQPDTLKSPEFLKKLQEDRWDMFIVAAYGKIIPADIINLPLHNTLNVHGSILPKYRGASPIQSAVLAGEKEIGVSIMLIDEQMDHGPVLAIEKIDAGKWERTGGVWPPTAVELEKMLGHMGGKLMAKTIPLWMDRKIEAIPQDHNKATYTKKFSKSDGEINLSDDPWKNFLKIQAFIGWPSAYFFEKETRMVIKKAQFKDGQLKILRVVPEGKKETDYKQIGY